MWDKENVKIETTSDCVLTYENFNRLKGELKSEDEQTQRFIYFYFNGKGCTTSSSHRYDMTNSTLSKYRVLFNNIHYRKYVCNSDKISFTEYRVIPMFQNKLFFQSKVLTTLCYYRKSRKFFVIGCDYPKQHMIRMLGFIGCDWFEKMDNNLKEFFNKELFKSIVSGRITNPEQYVKTYIRRFIRYPFHYRLFVSFMTEINYGYLKNELKMSHYEMLCAVRDHTVNPNETLRMLLDAKDNAKDKFAIFQDAILEARQLGKRIKHNWSYKRLTGEHSLMSEEIAKKSLGDNIQVPFFGELKTKSDDGKVELELIDSSEKAYLETITQSNCVFSSYWRNIQNKDYFILSVKKPERCTLGIDSIFSNGGKRCAFRMNQCYGKRNVRVDDGTKDKLKKWLYDKDVQMFFLNNYKRYDLEEEVTLMLDEEKVKELSNEKKTTNNEIAELLPF